MFAALGRFVVRNPLKVILAWVVVSVAVVAFSPRLTDIINADQTSFLPDSYESVQAQQLAERAFPQASGSTVIGVVKRADGAPLTDADVARTQQLAQRLSAAGIDRVAAAQTAPQAVSPNRSVQLVTVALQGTPQDEAVVAALSQVRQRSAEALEGSGLRIGYTGDVALFADSEEAFTDAERIVGIATVVLIVGLQLLIFRSPIAALFPIVSVGLVFTLAQSLIAAAGKLFDFEVGTELATLLTVVLFGIGTDYILFLLFRFRERLRAGDDPKVAIATAVERVGQAIASAAGVVIIAFSAMLLASLGFFTTLGPSLALAVALMLLAALTLIPALLALTGPRVFWPSRSWQRTPRAPVFARLGGLVARRPVLVALVSGAVVVALAAGTLGFRQNYDFVSQLPSDTESRKAFADLQSGFPAGALNPTQVYVQGDQPLDQAALARLGTSLQQVPGVGQVQPPQLSPDRRVGQVDLLLTMNPSSAEALDLVGPLREAAHAAAPPGTTVLVGGTTSATADLRQATGRDLKVIFPVAGLLIALILALLLRSLVAPLYLMLAVMGGYAASLGAAVFIFQGLGGEPGVLFLLPILVYLFVVAIGTDYNILMIARLREEAAAGNEPRAAADLAVEHAGPSVVSAGVILAGTFGSLLLAGVAFLTQMGVAVTVGIVLAAFVISVFLVPAVTALIGHRAWWPGRIERPLAGHGTDLLA
ncbi:MAG TPA: MMPL family transporter, partial [Actinomycetes bacterium]|nr:MMPL family transporter [Actinomycetes bacterium]